MIDHFLTWTAENHFYCDSELNDGETAQSLWEAMMSSWVHVAGARDWQTVTDWAEQSGKAANMRRQWTSGTEKYTVIQSSSPVQERCETGDVWWATIALTNCKIWQRLESRRGIYVERQTGKRWKGDSRNTRQRPEHDKYVKCVTTDILHGSERFWRIIHNFGS